MQLVRSFSVCLALVGLSLACASNPPAPSRGRGTVFGELTLRPHPGVTMPERGDATYSDPRLRDAQIVDYSQPGFAVVYLEGAPPAGEQVELSIRASQFDTRLEPRWAALAQNGTVTVRNTTGEPHTVSCPSLSLVARVGPGESLTIPVRAPGAHPLFLLDRPQAEAGFFAAPGPYAVLTRDPRFELRDVAPGHAELHAWHPRLPPVARAVDVLADQLLRVDLEMGVGRTPTETSDAGR